MSKKKCKDPNNCDKCKARTGLPIFLARYAIAPDKSDSRIDSLTAQLHLPKANKSQDQPSHDFIELGATAHYTLRTLRAGYVYLYDEARKSWKAYFVSESGHYTQFPTPTRFSRYPATSDKADSPPCDPENRGMASAISVDLPIDKATNIWIAYSGVEWTKKVFDDHQKEDVRKRHMRKINVKEWLTNYKHKHCSYIGELPGRVAEYSQKMRFADYGFTEPPLADYSLDAARVVNAFNSVHPLGVIIALDDPVGMALDLVTLINYRDRAFNEQNDDKYDFPRALKTAGRIGLLQKAVCDAAESKLIEEAEKKAEEYKDRLSRKKFGLTTFSYLERMEMPLDEYMSPAQIVEYKNIIDVPEWQMKKARDDVWANYWIRIRENEIKDFEDKYGRRRAEFIPRAVVPLAEAHAEWMRGHEMFGYFTGNFDSTHKGNGGAYFVEFFDCVGNTQIWEACAELYEEWLARPANDPQNLLKRALCFNQDEAINKELERGASACEEFYTKAQGSFDKKNIAEGDVEIVLGAASLFSPENIEKIAAFGLYYADLATNALKGSGKADPDFAHKFVQSTAARIFGPSAKFLNNPKNVHKEFLAILGGVDGKLPIPFQVKGSEAQIFDMFQGFFGGNAKTDKFLEYRIKRLGFQDNFRPGDPSQPNPFARPLSTQTQHTMHAMVSPDLAKRLSLYAQNPRAFSRVSVDRMMTELAQSLRLGSIEMGTVVSLNAQRLTVTWKSRIDQALANLRAHTTGRRMRHAARYLKVGGAAAGSVASIVFAVQGYKKFREALESRYTSNLDKIEQATQLAVGVVGGAAAMLVAFDAVLADPRIGRKFRWARSFHTRYGEKIARFGRRAGAAGAAVTAVWDVKNAYIADQEGDTLLATAYGASAIVGGASFVVLLFTAATGWGLVLMGVSVLLGFAITLIEGDGSLKWVQFSYFGRGGDFSKPGDIRLKNLWGENKENNEWEKVSKNISSS